MRVLIAALVAALALAGCSSGGGGADDGSTPEATGAPSPARKVRGEIEIAVEPLAMDELPEAPAAGFGRASLGERTIDFAVTFCDDDAPIGSGSGEGVEVAWDLRMDDGDHRASIRFTEDDERWVRGGPAEAEWDPEARTLRFAGAFVPFRTDDGTQARRGGIVAVCPPKG